MATVTEAYCISEGSGKETNHYVVSLKGSGIRYKPGDSLGFYPQIIMSWSRKLFVKSGLKRRIQLKAKTGKKQH